MFARFILFILVVFLSQCSHITQYGGPYHYIQHPTAVVPSRNLPVYLDAQFGEADKVEIQKALDQWNFALNGYLTLDVVDYRSPLHYPLTHAEKTRIESEHGILILRIDSASPLIQETQHPPRVLAFVYPVIGGNYVYLIRDRMLNDGVKLITMHELGHALGAHHTHGGLMNPEYYPYMYQCVDRPVLEEVASYQHLDFGRLNWCVYGDQEKVK